MTKTIQKNGVVGLIGAAAGLAGLLLAAAPTGAAAATADTSAAPATKNCVVLVGKAPANGGASPELYRYCSDKSAADARAHLKSSDALTKGGRSIQATALMSWYSDHNYGGNSTTVYGDFGSCDSSGYSLRPDGYWSTNLTSARGYGTCTVATFHNRALNFAATYRLPVPNVGGVLNDNVGLIQVYYG